MTIEEVKAITEEHKRLIESITGMGEWFKTIAEELEQ